MCGDSEHVLGAKYSFMVIPFKLNVLASIDSRSFPVKLILQ
jgi:hypothetical protein